MPVAQPRGLALSGLRHADPRMNKDHTEFYTIEDFAAIQVYYGLDGVSPGTILLYFRTDDEFPKLTKDNLEKRLSWEQERLKKLIAYFERRRAAVFVWEVDAELEEKLSQGLNSADFDVKLQAMLHWGKQQGYRLDHSPAQGEQTPRWSWYLGNQLMVEAYHDRGFEGEDGRPCNFIFYSLDGNRQRDERGWPSLQWIRWYRQNGTMVRLEGGSIQNGAWRPTTWCWYDKKEKAVRSEWDDNGDGIPDAYREGDFYKEEPRLSLSLRQSWAVLPELIPEDFRLKDQAKRCVPIRRIPQ